jgi:hypothetical protein
LKEKREHPQSEGKSSFPGIPFVTSSYQMVHIEGAKALITFIPHRVKGGTVLGPLQDAFLSTAAALLSVPECYQETLTHLEWHIEPERAPTPIYREQQFSTTSRLGVNEVAAFLAAVGMTTTKAEQWRPWAAAYVDMELDAHPNSMYAPMLNEARGLAQSRITKDPKWVLTSVHPSAPGHFDLQHIQNQTSQGSRKSHGKARQTEADSPTNTKAGPSSISRSNSTLRSVHPDDTEDNDAQLPYSTEQDEDSHMGPT